MRLKTLMAALFSLCLISVSYGQGWEQYYYTDSVPAVRGLDQTADNGFIVLTRNNNNLSLAPILIKTDVNGDTLWTKEIDAISSNYRDFYDIKQTTDGGYILAGEVSVGSSSGMYLVKTDANGDTLWTQTYGGIGSYTRNVHQTADGGYMVLGGIYTGSNDADLRLVKTDANGVLLWTQTYGGITLDVPGYAEPTSDGGYVIIGSIRPGGGVTNRDVYLIKTDANGNASWTQTYGTVADDDRGIEVHEVPGGGYIFASSYWDASFNKIIALTRVDALGVIRWDQTYGNYSSVEALLQTNVAGPEYILVGRESNGSNYLLRTDDLGNTLWSKVITNPDNHYCSAAITVGNGYALTGYQQRDFNVQTSRPAVFLWRMDSLANTYTNYIKGNIFDDVNLNCLKDAGEQNFEGTIVRAVGNRTWYGTSDSLGNYCIGVDTGSYVVTADLSIYWQTCANNVSVTFSSFYTNDTIDFPLQAQINCPLMQVDLSAPFIRTGAVGSYYSVDYCNNGTIAAVNAFVEVTIDADLDVLNTSLPIASQVGNVLTFNLGTVDYGNCGSFNIQVRAKITAILGQTHCSQAHIFPDSLCLPAWTGGIIDPSADCQNDSVTFKLENIGNGLFNSETYYVFEDHVIMRTGNTGNILVGNSFNLTIPADTGRTYRISVPQNTGFPQMLGDSIASVAIEGCVPYLTGTFNLGFITQFYNGNSAPFIAVDCQPNIGSYDPNDKSAQPTGYDAQNYIYNYTDLDYKIRFQNTGTDTAFLVVIRDTISPLLDLSTLAMGASSHDYTWRVYGERILEITFENIMLPDSNVNELASNGFVRYRIEQNDGNAVGNVIYNGADIYFDFNAPIKTNQTFHTIGDNFVTVMLSQTEVLDEAIQVNVYPNPFTQNATIEVEGKDYKELQLIIYDVSGRVIVEKQAYSNNKIELSRGNLQAGVYFYQLLGGNALINTGKIVVQ